MWKIFIILGRRKADGPIHQRNLSFSFPRLGYLSLKFLALSPSKTRIASRIEAASLYKSKETLMQASVAKFSTNREDRLKMSVSLGSYS